MLQKLDFDFGLVHIGILGDIREAILLAAVA